MSWLESLQILAWGTIFHKWGSSAVLEVIEGYIFVKEFVLQPFLEGTFNGLPRGTNQRILQGDRRNLFSKSVFWFLLSASQLLLLQHCQMQQTYAEVLQPVMKYTAQKHLTVFVFSGSNLQTYFLNIEKESWSSSKKT